MPQIILRLHDGRIAYSRPCSEPAPGERESEYLARVTDRTIAQLALVGFPDTQFIGLLEDGAIPSDPVSWKYRDAWEFSGGVISIDVEKAKPVALEALRKQRNAELEKLDIDEMRFGGESEKLQEVRSRKQQLRDAPVTLAAAVSASKSIDELEAIVLP